MSQNELAMSLNPESKYPTRRAYVVKVRSGAKPNALAGRLENLVTGAQREFTCGGEFFDVGGEFFEDAGDFFVGEDFEGVFFEECEDVGSAFEELGYFEIFHGDMIPPLGRGRHVEGREEGKVGFCGGFCEGSQVGMLIFQQDCQVRFGKSAIFQQDCQVARKFCVRGGGVEGNRISHFVSRSPLAGGPAIHRFHRFAQILARFACENRWDLWITSKMGLRGVKWGFVAVFAKVLRIRC